MIPSIEALRVPGDLSARLHREARAAYPREACGFLIGGRTGGGATVRRLIAVENRAARQDRFLIDARDVFEAMRSTRREGSEVLGVYHSHPDAAPVPSAVDRGEAWAEWLYLIVACRGGKPGRHEMACWRWNGESFAAVRFVDTVAAGSGERARRAVAAGSGADAPDHDRASDCAADLARPAGPDGVAPVAVSEMPEGSS